MSMIDALCVFYFLSSLICWYLICLYCQFTVYCIVTVACGAIWIQSQRRVLRHCSTATRPARAFSSSPTRAWPAECSSSPLATTRSCTTCSTSWAPRTTRSTGVIADQLSCSARSSPIAASSTYSTCSRWGHPSNSVLEHTRPPTAPISPSSPLTCSTRSAIGTASSLPCSSKTRA